jgi:ATP-dependent NAD(P)H-hydrate dehydratase
LHLAPPLDGCGHKGGAGRIGMLGGSVDYARKPFHARMAALRVGAELLYLIKAQEAAGPIITAQEAAGPIKSYSSELSVSSVYNTHHLIEGEEGANGVLAMVARVEAKLPMMHALVIGPGLGRSPNVLKAVASIMNSYEIQVIFSVSYSNAVLTPNAMEYMRLCTAVSQGKSVNMTVPELYVIYPLRLHSISMANVNLHPISAPFSTLPVVAMPLMDPLLSRK